jgi:hypothetical protein
MEICFYPLMSLAVLNLVNSRDKLRWIIIMFVFAATVQAIIGFTEYFFNVDFLMHQQGLENVASRMQESVGSASTVRVSGTWGSNFFGTVMASMIPLTIVMFYISKGTIKKIIFLSSFALMFFGVIVSFTRIAVLGLAGVVIFLIYKYRARISLVKISIIILIIFALVIGILNHFNSVYLNLYVDRIKSIGNIFNYKAINLSNPGNKVAEATRLVHYSEAIKMIRSNILTGIGPGNSQNYMLQHGAYPQLSGTIHNMFLLLIAEYGIIAFIIHLWIIYASWKNYLRVEKIARLQGDRELHLMVIGLQCSIISTLIAFQTQPEIIPKYLVILYSLSGAIGCNILTRKDPPS